MTAWLALVLLGFGAQEIPEREVRVDLEQGSDHRAIQEAVDRLAREGGGTVRLGPGRCVLRNAVTLRDKIRIAGTPGKTILAGRAGGRSLLARDTRPGDTTIVLAEPDLFRAGDGIALRDSRYASGFTVTTATLGERKDGNAFALTAPLDRDYQAARKAVALQAFPLIGGWKIRDAAVEDVILEGTRDGESVDGCRAGGVYLYECERVAIRRTTVRNYRGDGISFQWRSRHIRVEECVVENCSGLGLHPGSMSYESVIRGSAARGSGGAGLFVCQDVHHVLFENNEFRDNRGPGISIGYKDTDNTFRRNAVTGNGKAGILFRDDGGEERGAHRNVFEENRVVDNPAACVLIEGVHLDLVFRGNTFGAASPADAAIVVAGEARNLVRDSNRLVNFASELSTRK